MKQNTNSTLLNTLNVQAAKPSAMRRASTCEEGIHPETQRLPLHKHNTLESSRQTRTQTLPPQQTSTREAGSFLPTGVGWALKGTLTSSAGLLALPPAVPPTSQRPFHLGQLLPCPYPHIIRAISPRQGAERKGGGGSGHKSQLWLGCPEPGLSQFTLEVSVHSVLIVSQGWRCPSQAHSMTLH